MLACFSSISLPCLVLMYRRRAPFYFYGFRVVVGCWALAGLPVLLLARLLGPVRQYGAHGARVEELGTALPPVLV